jgi:hypothetical protein
MKLYSLLVLAILIGLFPIHSAIAQDIKACEKLTEVSDKERENCRKMIRDTFNVSQAAGGRVETLRQVSQTHSQLGMHENQWSLNFTGNVTNTTGRYPIPQQSQWITQANFKTDEGTLYSLILERDKQVHQFDGTATVQIQTNLTPVLKVTTSLGGASLDRFDPQFIAKIAPQYTLYYNLKSSFYVSIGTTFQVSKYKFGNLFQATPALTIGTAEPSISLNIGYNASQATNVTAQSPSQLAQPTAINGFQYTLSYQPITDLNLSLTYMPINTSAFLGIVTRETAWTLAANYQLTKAVSAGITYQYGWVNYSPIGRLYELNNVGGSLSITF